MDNKCLHHFIKESNGNIKYNLEIEPNISDQETIRVNFSKEGTSLPLVEKLKILREILTPIIDNIIEENSKPHDNILIKNNITVIENIILYLNIFLKNINSSTSIFSNIDSHNQIFAENNENIGLYITLNSDKNYDTLQWGLLKIKISNCLSQCLSELVKIQKEIKDRYVFRIYSYKNKFLKELIK